MAHRFFFDHCVHGAVVRGLRERGVDVLTAQEDGSHELSDAKLLKRATLLGRVLYTNDDDLLSEAAVVLDLGEPFPGLVFTPQTRLSIGRQIDELELIAHGTTTEEVANIVTYLPL